MATLLPEVDSVAELQREKEERRGTGGDKQCSKGYRVGMNSIPRGTEWG